MRKSFKMGEYEFGVVILPIFFFLRSCLQITHKTCDDSLWYAKAVLSNAVQLNAVQCIAVGSIIMGKKSWIMNPTQFTLRNLMFLGGNSYLMLIFNIHTNQSIHYDQYVNDPFAFKITGHAILMLFIYVVYIFVISLKSRHKEKKIRLNKDLQKISDIDLNTLESNEYIQFSHHHRGNVVGTDLFRNALIPGAYSRRISSKEKIFMASFYIKLC